MADTPEEAALKTSDQLSRKLFVIVLAFVVGFIAAAYLFAIR